VTTAPETHDLLEKMRANFALVSELGLRRIDSDYWRELLSRGRQDHGGKEGFLDHEDLWANFRNNVITKGLDNANVPEEAVPRVRAKCREMYERLSDRIPGTFRKFLEESPIGSPRTHEVDGIPVTQSSIEYTYMLSHLAPYLGSVRVVVDIGGGYGGLARLIKLARPDMRLVVLDLPEANAIQTYFLASAFPRARVLGLSDVVGLDPIDPRSLDFDFLVLPGQLFERLSPSSFDAVINTRSMMEMDLGTVGFYLRHIQDKIADRGVFYSVNRYAKKTRLKDYPFDERWRVAYSEPWPRFIDENPHHEIIALREADPVENGLKEQVAGFPPHDGILGRMRTVLKRVAG
jgi:putative sugar O-methyltransferase